MGKILRYVLGLVDTVVLAVRIDGGDIVVSVRPWKTKASRCPVCGKKCECHDHLKTRRWRALDIGRAKCYLEYAPARVKCPEHDVHEERLPWARTARVRCTIDFEDWVACLAIHGPLSWVERQARVEWHSIGGICKRVYDDLQARRGVGRFDGLVKVGVDEL